MGKIDHYMVEYLGAADEVTFANVMPITSLSAAKSLASKASRDHDTGAYVVAFEQSNQGRFEAVGHISFFDGRQSETAGMVI